jgi:hypothetical protein
MPGTRRRAKGSTVNELLDELELVVSPRRQPAEPEGGTSSCMSITLGGAAAADAATVTVTITVPCDPFTITYSITAYAALDM